MHSLYPLGSYVDFKILLIAYTPNQFCTRCIDIVSRCHHHETGTRYDEPYFISYDMDMHLHHYKKEMCMAHV